MLNKNTQGEQDQKCILYCKKMLGHLDNVLLHSIFTLDTCILNCSKFQEQKKERKQNIKKKDAK